MCYRAGWSSTTSMFSMTKVCDGMQSFAGPLGPSMIRQYQKFKSFGASLRCRSSRRMALNCPGKKAAALRRTASSMAGSDAWTAVQQAIRLEEEAVQAVLSSTSVIAATCISAGDPRLVAEVRWGSLYKYI